jgi:hypothetical protein
MQDLQHPQWWTESRVSAWDRVKAALKRDWEQTKADLGPRGSGRDVNQNATDTFRQAGGSVPIPPPYEPNAPSEDDLKRHSNQAVKAQQQAQKMEKRAAEAEPGTNKAERLDKKAAEARKVALDAELDLQRNREKRWADVEDAVQFGYIAALHHNQRAWSDSLETNLKEEWNSMYRDRPWGEMREYVAMGWDRAHILENR